MLANLSTIITAGITFVATNIDDIFILMVFFSNVDATFRRRHVVVGQYLGFLALVTISLVGFFSSFIISQEWIGVLGLAPIYLGVRKLFKQEDKEQVPVPKEPSIASSSLLSSLLQKKTYSVAVVTFANGGDNIGIYTPLFASQNPWQMIVILTVFLSLVAVWCLLGYGLAHDPHVARMMVRYGHVLVPFVMISLGIYILLENRTLGLLGI
jgi:cadmium resistance transport/sequestration family protein